MKCIEHFHSSFCGYTSMLTAPKGIFIFYGGTVLGFCLIRFCFHLCFWEAWCLSVALGCGFESHLLFPHVLPVLPAGSLLLPKDMHFG